MKQQHPLSEEYLNLQINIFEQKLLDIIHKYGNGSHEAILFSERLDGLKQKRLKFERNQSLFTSYTQE
ncbi:hypothetical protein ACE38V_01410 [Cytobacillus sp. Hz8]|uniref:hypothetical protein n=1 Tax=Cytobacillus sp. Hz8 TaxID=3347168 RepID=UPI0035E333CD